MKMPKRAHTMHKHRHSCPDIVAHAADEVALSGAPATHAASMPIPYSGRRRRRPTEASVLAAGAGSHVGRSSVFLFAAFQSARRAAAIAAARAKATAAAAAAAAAAKAGEDTAAAAAAGLPSGDDDDDDDDIDESTVLEPRQRGDPFADQVTVDLMREPSVCIRLESHIAGANETLQAESAGDDNGGGDGTQVATPASVASGIAGSGRGRANTAESDLSR